MQSWPKMSLQILLLYKIWLYDFLFKIFTICKLGMIALNQVHQWTAADSKPDWPNLKTVWKERGREGGQNIAEIILVEKNTQHTCSQWRVRQKDWIVGHLHARFFGTREQKPNLISILIFWCVKNQNHISSVIMWKRPTNISIACGS